MEKYLFIFESGEMTTYEGELQEEDRQSVQDGELTIVRQTDLHELGDDGQTWVAIASADTTV